MRQRVVVEVGDSLKVSAPGADGLRYPVMRPGKTMRDRETGATARLYANRRARADANKGRR